MTDYNVMGMMAMVPGVQRAIDRLVEFKEELLAAAAAARTGETNGSAREFIERTGKKRGRSPKVADPILTAAATEAEREFRRKSKAVKGYWAKLTPEERSAEMRRRGAKRKDRKQPEDLMKLHPRDPRSPRHDAYIKKLRKGQLNFWNNLSEEERVKRVNQMQNGRAA